jgi:ABC-type microcin C transport system permease subunit YejE
MKRCNIMNKLILSLVVFALILDNSIAANDTRQLIEFPPMMRQHLLSNMRDHLAAITEIQQALSSGTFDQAAEIAEKRIGMSSLISHGASHMAPYMPKAMQKIGTQMHRAASQFALIAQESAVDGDIKRAIGGLAKITQQCVACHAAFRVH